MDFVSYKDRKAIATELKDIYRAINAQAAEAALSEFEAGPWGQKYPAIGQSWRRVWEQVIPFFAFPADVRRIIYTTDEMDKTRRTKMCYGGNARATPWRRVEPRLRVPSGRLVIVLPVWSVRAPLALSPIGQRIVRRPVQRDGRLPFPDRAVS